MLCSCRLSCKTMLLRKQWLKTDPTIPRESKQMRSPRRLVIRFIFVCDAKALQRGPHVRMDVQEIFRRLASRHMLEPALRTIEAGLGCGRPTSKKYMYY